MSDEYVTVYNPSDTPVVVDSEGRVIGGTEWGTARRLAPEVKDAIGRGSLIARHVPANAPNLTENAAAAAKEAEGFNTRHAALSGVDKDVLVAAALAGADSLTSVSPNVVDGLNSDHAHKVDVLDALVRSDIAIDDIAAPASSPEPQASEGNADDGSAGRKNASKKGA